MGFEDSEDAMEGGCDLIEERKEVLRILEQAQETRKLALDHLRDYLTAAEESPEEP